MALSTPNTAPDQVIGRYALFREIASGGMASVHLARLLGTAGFSRVVAIKRLHSHLARDPDFVSMFVDEARLAARVQHPNVVPTLDVVALDGEIFIVMEYVEGESLARLARIAQETHQRFPLPVVLSVVLGALHGMHAAHEARGEDGQPLELVHRDISPQNVLVGIDGMARVVDFGIAKAAGRSSRTASGVIKGKLPYMAPEQIRIEALDRRTDVYAISIVLWELLAGKRLFIGENEWEIATQIRKGVRTPPSTHNREVTPALDAIVLKGCALAPDARYQTALEMAEALEQIGPAAGGRAVGRFVESMAAKDIAQRRRMVAEAESVKSGVGVLQEPSADIASQPTGTRLGGVFARASVEPQAISAPGRLEDGPGTATSWTGPTRRLSAPLIGVLAGLLVASVIGVVALIVRLAGGGGAGDPPVVQAVEPPAVELQPSEPPIEPSAEPSAEPTPPPPPAADSAVVKPKQPRTTTQPPVQPRTTTQPPATTTAPKSKESCWYIDSDGERRFRKGCKWQ